MAKKTLKKAKWFWQDYPGTNWNNVEAANSGEEGLAAYAYPKGTKPRSLFYHYQFSGVDSSKYKLDKVEFVLYIGKFKESENDLPTIKVFNGDNNAPYKTNPIKKVSSATRRANPAAWDTYSLAFNITGVTFSQLKNIIIEVDWNKSKVPYQSTISVNRGRLEINYSLKAPKWTLQNTLYRYSAPVNEKIGWKLSAKNTGECGSGKVRLQLPKGMTVDSTSGGGSYNSTTMVWSYDACKNKTVERVFYLKSSSVGIKKIKAINDSAYATNASITREVTFEKYEPPVVRGDDIITYTFYDTFAKEANQYFDVQIQGLKENHTNGTACYVFTTSNNVQLYTPLKDNVELVDVNANVDGIITESVANNTVCLSVTDFDEDFTANVRVYMYCTNDNDGTITITANNKTYTQSFDIMPARSNVFLINPSISRDKQYVLNSINIGVPNIWTIRATSSRHNFHDEKASDFMINVEKMIAYIGPVPIQRPHSRDVKANTTNTLINNTYRNRKYLGKVGDTEEEIPMTLRMKWQDVVTLQGLAAMDKPVPIDLIPELPDGDPVNHRGWAELYAVKNIRKINDLLYECEPAVDYLTHALLTKFMIEEKGNLTDNKIDYFLSETCTYNDNLLERFNINYSQFWTNVEDEQGNITGYYELEPLTNLKLNSIDALKDHSNYNICFRNELPALMSEDYDKNWEMALRIVDKDSRDVLFEHSYNNFKHYDFTNGIVRNTADVTTKLLQGDKMNIINFDNMVLGYDNLAPLLNDSKIRTHFSELENPVFDDNNTSFEAYLLDDNNVGIVNELVDVRISNAEGYVERFTVLTDRFGRFGLNMHLENGAYTLEFIHNLTRKYKGSTYSKGITIAYDNTDTVFTYANDFVTFDTNLMYEATLKTAAGTALSGKMVSYAFRDLSSEYYGHEETLLTNSSGKIKIPIAYNNGSKELKVTFKGDGTYNPCFFEDIIDINIQGENAVIESDDVELVQGDALKEYHIILKDDEGNTLANKPVTISFYKQDESYVLETITNEYGVAKQPIYLNKGAWNVDTIFKGDSTYKPVVNTNEILVREYIQLETKLLSENVILDESEIMAGNQDYYTLTLLDENDRPVENEPISIIIFNNDKTEKYVDVVLETDDKGILKVPFVSHNETVIIDATYHGCNRYDSCSKTERVSFEQNHVKNDVTFFVNSNTGEINLTEGTYTDHVLTGTFDGEYDIIVNNPNNDRICNIGANYLASLDDGTYNVTFVYHGTENYYPTMTTIEWEHGNDTRFSTYDNFISMQGADNADFNYFIVPTMDVGKLNHMKVMFYYEVPKTIVYIAVGYSSNSTPNSLTDLKNNSDYVVAGVPQRWKSSLGTGRSYVEFDFVEPANKTIGVWIPPTDHTFAKWDKSTYDSPGTTTLRNATITQSGFGNMGETYQDFTVSVTGASAAADENINPYLIAKLININTFEELYYYSYLINQMTITELQFLLEKGDWTLNIVSKESSKYKGAAYATTATIDTDTPLLVASLDPLFDYDNWIDKGAVSIESHLNSMQEKITTIQTSTTDLLHSVLDYELTESTDYKLSFKWDVHYSDDYNMIYFGVNIDADDNLDGIWIRPDKVEEYKDNTLINSVTFSGTYSNFIDVIDVTVRRKGNQYLIYFGGDLMYVSENAAHNNFGVYAIGQAGAEQFTQFRLYDVVPTVTPPIDENNLNNEIFGSDVHLEIKKNRLTLIDYGMLPDGELQNGKVILNNIQLKEGTYELEIDIKYNNNRFERINNLNGLIKMNIFEDISLSDGALKYANIQCSPVPVMNSITKYTRRCDEGTMYYIEKPKDNNARYLCNPYIQYKGGTDLKTSTGISIFDLDNGYSPVMLSNGLVRAEFHRRSGYIVLSRYDENTELWYRCNTFKISNEPNLSLDENYSDDKATVRFGDTKWTMWRGRPFIKLEHSDTNIRILDLVDRVYCETLENEFSMGFVEEHNTYMSIFNPRLSIQQFKEEWHIGEDIRLENFNLYSMTYSGGKYYVGNLLDTGMELVDDGSDNAIKVTKESSTRLGLNFPASPVYVAKPGSTFTLLIDNISTMNNKSIIVKARGFDERGCVHAIEDIEYGIWEQQKTVNVNSCNWILDGSYSSESLDSCESYLMRGNPSIKFSDSLRVTFTGCPEEVKYVDFIVIFPSYDDTIRIKNIMLYEGSDEGLKHYGDTSKANASLVEINFAETYYACLYNENSPAGLAIVRPDKKKFGLRTLEASDETLLIPYMKKYADHDAVENVMLEYFNSKNQIINIDWEG